MMRGCCGIIANIPELIRCGNKDLSGEDIFCKECKDYYKKVDAEDMEGGIK